MIVLAAVVLGEDIILLDPQGALSRRRIPVRVLAANKALDSFLPRMPRFMRGART